MKYILQHIHLLIGIALVIQAIACQTTSDESCLSIHEPVKVIIEDSTVYDISFSPFDQHKIQLHTGYKTKHLWEVDKTTGHMTALEKQRYTPFYSDNYRKLKDYYTDPFDSLVWKGGPNGNVEYYDQRIKTIQELPLRHVFLIIPKQELVYLVSVRGLFYWDRKSKKIHQVTDVPLDVIQQAGIPNDTVLVIDKKYAYLFNSKQVKKWSFFDQYMSIEKKSSFNASDYLVLYNKEDSLWFVFEGKTGKLPLIHNQIGRTSVINRQYCQFDRQFFYSFNPKTNKNKRYAYRLPAINNYVPGFSMDSRYLYIQRPGQLMLVRLSDNQHFEFPVAAEEQYIKTIFDECNVYTLYRNKLIICTKADFIKKCRPFDVEKYEKDLEAFEYTIDSLGILHDTLASSALMKLKYLKKRYSGVDHIEILQQLQSMDWRAFQGVHFYSPHEYTACYRDSSLPVSRRRYCLIELTSQYGRAADFEKVIYLDQEYNKYLGKWRSTEYYEYISDLDSVKRYYSQIDSLSKLNLSADSLYYFRALALETVCKTSWFCYEGCAGCDFSLVINKMKTLPEKFPQSKLVDNAAFYLIYVASLYSHGEEEALIEGNKQYEKFLQKYPDSDLKADALYNIYMNWMSMYMPDKAKTKSAGLRFIKAFPADKRVSEVKEGLSSLEID